MEDSILTNATVKAKVSIEGGISPQINDGESSLSVDPIVMAFFKLDEADLTKDQKEKLSEIDEWVKLKSENSPSNYLGVLQDIRFRLGAPSLGQSDLNHIHQYVRLRASASKLLDQAKAMEQ